MYQLGNLADVGPEGDLNGGETLHAQGSKHYLHEMLSPWTIVHISGKAKENNILSGFQRASLFRIGSRKMKSKSPLTRKQSEFLDSIILEAIDKGIAQAPCKRENCSMCSEISALVGSKTVLREEKSRLPSVKPGERSRKHDSAPQNTISRPPAEPASHPTSESSLEPRGKNQGDPAHLLFGILSPLVSKKRLMAMADQMGIQYEGEKRGLVDTIRERTTFMKSSELDGYLAALKMLVRKRHLVGVCRNLGLSPDGTKEDMMGRIENYLGAHRTPAEGSATQESAASTSLPSPPEGNMRRDVLDVESTLRDFILKSLTRHYGSDWYRQGVPQDVKESIERVIDKDTSKYPYKSAELKKNPARLLEYTSIVDLVRIITWPNNWREFCPVFRNAEETRRRAEQLQSYRNHVMHHRRLDETVVGDGTAAKSWFLKCIESR